MKQFFYNIQHTLNAFMYTLNVIPHLMRDLFICFIKYFNFLFSKFSSHTKLSRCHSGLNPESKQKLKNKSKYFCLEKTFFDKFKVHSSFASQLWIPGQARNDKIGIIIVITLCSLSSLTAQPNRYSPSSSIEIGTKNKDGESIEMLLEHSLEAHPYLKSLEKTKEEKKATSNAYLSRFFPSTSASFTASKVNDYSKLQTVLGLSATQKIIDLGAAQDLTVAKSNYTLADYQKQLGHDYVQAKVEFTFLAAWLQTQRKDVIESLKKSSYSTFQRAQAQFNAGTTSRNDLMVAAAIHATNLKTIEQYENELDDAFVALEKATNLSFRKNKIYENLEWNPHKNIDIPNIKTALQQASVNRKELYVNSQEADSAKQQELAYKKDYLPTLGLYGTWQRRQDSTATDPYNAHEAGLAASWNFFDGGNSYFNSQAYHARNLRLHEDRLATLQTIDSEVRSAHHSLLVNLRDLQLKDVQLSKEKDTFEQQKSRFESGLLVQSEYDAAIYTWNTAQINWLQQKINAETARKVLEAKCGYPK